MSSFRRDGFWALIDDQKVIRVTHYRRGTAADGGDYEVTFVTPCKECHGDRFVSDGARDFRCPDCDGTGEMSVLEHCMSAREFESFEAWALAKDTRPGCEQETRASVMHGIAMAQTERAPAQEGEAA